MISVVCWGGQCDSVRLLLIIAPPQVKHTRVNIDRTPRPVTRDGCEQIRDNEIKCFLC